VARSAVRVWAQGQCAAVSNADGYNIWLLDIASSSPAVELQVRGRLHLLTC
jgi:hypothetical protein